jgi:transposase, IS5 family
LHQVSYEQLAFHLVDSAAYRAFARVPMGWKPNRSVPQRNIASISAAGWEEINRTLVVWARDRKLESGRKIRMDSTAVACDIHHPTDSELLYDCVRTVTRLLGALRKRRAGPRASGDETAEISFRDHRRRAKRRRYKIVNSRGENRREAYRDLLKVARKTHGYGRAALEATAGWADPKGIALGAALEHYPELTARVIDQTERRVIRGESVPAEEKVVSIFEDHADIIKKGQREPVFGHKIFPTCGPTSLILNCEVARGNPADVSRTTELLKEHRRVYGKYPRQVAADQGFYSRTNLDTAKEAGIRDVVFDRKGSLRIEDMAGSSWIYRHLRRFRAGIEGCISRLKRIFGLRRCTWRGWNHFQQYVHASVVACNLLVLARLLL